MTIDGQLIGGGLAIDLQQIKAIAYSIEMNTDVNVV